VIFVTGADGFIGSHLVERCHWRGDEVLGGKYQPTVNVEEIDPQIKFVYCDVTDASRVAAVLDEYRPDKIFHLAAQSYPTVSWDLPRETMDTNAGGTISIFEAVKLLKAKDLSYDPVVVVACSSAEYGASFSDEIDQIAEDAALLPLSPYGVSKVAQDLLAYQYCTNDSIRAIRARIFNTTGPRKTGDVCSDFIRRLVAAERSLTDELELSVGNLDSTRAILDVQDTINALDLLSSGGRPGGVYNICSASCVRIGDIIGILESIFGRSIRPVANEALLRPSDEQRIFGSTTRLTTDTTWRQSVSLRDTLSAMVAYWRSRG